MRKKYIYVIVLGCLCVLESQRCFKNYILRIFKLLLLHLLSKDNAILSLKFDIQKKTSYIQVKTHPYKIIQIPF